jgi:predicted transcriptional regulator with HTH domain
MFDVSRFFGKGDRNTLLMKNGLNFSYNGPYSVVEDGLVMDQWHVNTFTTAEYTISVDYDTNNKEILKVLVSASPNQSSLSIYGRSNLGANLITINSEVNNSYVRILVNPAVKSQTEKYTGSKLIFGAHYFATQNALVGGSQVTE